MAISIHKLKDKSGRRITGYRATLDGTDEIAANGQTPAEAKRKLESVIPLALNHLRTEARTLSLEKYQAVIYPGWWESEAVWHSQIICPDGHNCSRSHGSHNLQQTIDSVATHMAQMSWPDIQEADCVPFLARESSPDNIRAFESWVQFQERYKVLKRLGYNENQCHSIASGDPRMVTYEQAMQPAIYFTQTA